MELVAWDGWEQGEGEHDAKQKEGPARNRKKAGDLGPREQGQYGMYWDLRWRQGTPLQSFSGALEKLEFVLKEMRSQ